MFWKLLKNVWDSGVPLFFINSLLTITIFPNIVIITVIYDYRETTHVTIIVFHGLSVCCPFFSGLLFRLTASSRPGFPYSPFSSNAVSSPNFQVQTSLHSERSARWRCKLFPLTVLQIKDLPRWWTRWTNGLYRGPTQEKNYFAPGGNWTRIAQLRVRRSTSRPLGLFCQWQISYIGYSLSRILNKQLHFN